MNRGTLRFQEHWKKKICYFLLELYNKNYLTVLYGTVINHYKIIKNQICNWINTKLKDKHGIIKPIETVIV